MLTLIEARRAEHAARTPCDPLRYVLLDTPGQIEIFTWSASGQIITEQLQLGEHAVPGSAAAAHHPRLLAGAPWLPPASWPGGWHGWLWLALRTLRKRPRPLAPCESRGKGPRLGRRRGSEASDTGPSDIAQVARLSDAHVCGLRGGHTTLPERGHLHVEHALRLLHPLQDEAAVTAALRTQGPTHLQPGWSSACPPSGPVLAPPLALPGSWSSSTRRTLPVATCAWSGCRRAPRSRPQPQP